MRLAAIAITAAASSQPNDDEDDNKDQTERSQAFSGVTGDLAKRRGADHDANKQR
jgi:hypothetical protein